MPMTNEGGEATRRAEENETEDEMPEEEEKENDTAFNRPSPFGESSTEQK